MMTPQPFEAVLESVRGVEMSRWERRAQAINFSTYNLLIDRDYDPWMVLLWTAKAYDERHGAWREGAK